MYGNPVSVHWKLRRWISKNDDFAVGHGCLHSLLHTCLKLDKPKKKKKKEEKKEITAQTPCDLCVSRHHKHLQHL